MPNDVRVLDPQAVKALAHPVRVALYNELAAHGPSTATALGGRIGESSGSTSYHLRQLARHGFVEEVTDRGSGRERWWRRVPGPVRIDGHSPNESPSQAATERIAAIGFNDFAEQQIRRSIARDLSTVPDDWRRATDLSAAILWLSAADAAELSHAFHEVLERFRDRFDLDVPEPGTERVFVRLAILPILDDPEES